MTDQPLRNSNTRARQPRRGRRSLPQSITNRGTKYSRVLCWLVGALFNLWKSFPEAVRSVILVLLIGALIGISHRDQKQSTDVAMDRRDQSSVACPQGERVTPPRSAVAGGRKPVKLARGPATNGEGRSQFLSAVSAQTSMDLADARLTLLRGNHAEAFRKFRAVFDSLPAAERSRLGKEAQTAMDTYYDDDFPQSAHRMQQLFPPASLRQ